MKCAVVKRLRHRRGTTLNKGTKPMGGFMPFGGIELGRTERECAPYRWPGNNAVPSFIGMFFVLD